MSNLKIWQEEVKIPTYGVGAMDKNPMFFEKRVYQGSSGKVYPLPVIDKIMDEKEDQTYTLVFLENDFIQVQVMPELGGRIYRAIDKTNNYDFVYYNQVIKPALVGLTGPWISGGIEFNWPQHHRPNTYGPVEYKIDDSQANRKTIWLSERDRMYGTKVTTGISIYDDSSKIEIHSELYNPTNESQTFLWWANPAVSVHEETQSIFPPDVHAVMDHGKRDVSRFPIATGTYYKMDYSSGVDISRYKNIPVPTSYMAYHSDYDFVGGYDWRAKAGILHVADHHISPGKKQWTWGCAEFGQAWDRNLTDEDGPYIELMTGVFTDNQPDFTWLAPYSGKSFTQYFMPYRELGQVKCANKDFAVSLDANESGYQLGIYASSISEDVKITVNTPDGNILSEKCNISPSSVYKTDICTSYPEYMITVKVSCSGKKSLVYKLEKPEEMKLPAKAKAIDSPDRIVNNEALYLAGKHLEQYRHATFSPEQYYLEGLKRDPADIRINNAYGNILFLRGQFAEAYNHFDQARKTVSRHNSNPYDGEVFFNLGKTCQAMGNDDEAYDHFYKACWSDTWKTQGYLKLAQISLKRGDMEEAADFARESLLTSQKNHKARAVLTVSQRLLGQKDEAASTANQTLEFDPLDFAALYELSLIEASEDARSAYLEAMGGNPHNYITLAIIYLEIGLYEQAILIIDDYLVSSDKPYAMTLYYRAYCLQKLADSGADSARGEQSDVSDTRLLAVETSVSDAWSKAAAADKDYCFPNSVEDYIVLSDARIQNPQDACAPYYLGCLLYDRRLYHQAGKLWEEAAKLDDTFPTVYRNLALYQANKLSNKQQAKVYLEKAFTLDRTDARVFYELCDLYKKLGMDAAELVQIMQENHQLVASRDDLTVSYIELLNITENYELAIDIITSRRFHPWEGGEGKVPTQHIEARIGLARKLLAASSETAARKAIEHLEKATVYYDNFGEGKLTGAQENNIYYYLGLAYSAAGKRDKAEECLLLASEGSSEPTSAVYYNDQPPHMIFYQGLALKSLGREDEARSRFNKLINYGEDNMYQEQKMDYFAVSMPDFMVFDADLNDSNRTHCYYMIGLGNIGLGCHEAAKTAFEEALKITPNHSGVLNHMKLL